MQLKSYRNVNSLSARKTGALRANTVKLHLAAFDREALCTRVFKRVRNGKRDVGDLSANAATGVRVRGKRDVVTRVATRKTQFPHFTGLRKSAENA